MAICWRVAEPESVSKMTEVLSVGRACFISRIQNSIVMRGAEEMRVAVRAVLLAVATVTPALNMGNRRPSIQVLFELPMKD